MASITEPEEQKTMHFVDRRLNQQLDKDVTFSEEDTFISKLESRSREIRLCTVSTLLIIWALLMLPYDIYGSFVDDDIVKNHNLFISSLDIWLIAHICVITASLLSFMTLKHCLLMKHWIINIELLLISTASCLQVLGSMCFAYSYCENLASSKADSLWTACVSKCHGLYMLYNAGFITYFGFIIFANKFNGDIPLVSMFVFKDWWHGNNDDNAFKFTKNFRVSFLCIFSFIGMILILVFGYETYPEVGASYQAIYVGYTFMIFGTFIVLLAQMIFHWRCCCGKIKEKNRKHLLAMVFGDDSIANANLSASDIQIQEKRKKEYGKSIESVLHLAVYFLIFAGIVMVFMYSLVSKIPEAENKVERVRLIGNMIIVTGTGLVLCYELFSKKDSYDGDGNAEHQYHIIHDEEL